MSNNVNTQLLERAAEMVDYWTNTLHAELIEKALEANDLDAVRYHTVNAEGAAAQQEMEASDVY